MSDQNLIHGGLFVVVLIIFVVLYMFWHETWLWANHHYKRPKHPDAHFKLQTTQGVLGEIEFGILIGVYERDIECVIKKNIETLGPESMFVVQYRIGGSRFLTYWRTKKLKLVLERGAKAYWGKPALVRQAPLDEFLVTVIDEV